MLPSCEAGLLSSSRRDDLCYREASLGPCLPTEAQPGQRSQALQGTVVQIWGLSDLWAPRVSLDHSKGAGGDTRRGQLVLGQLKGGCGPTGLNPSPGLDSSHGRRAPAQSCLQPCPAHQSPALASQSGPCAGFVGCSCPTGAQPQARQGPGLDTDAPTLPLSLLPAQVSLCRALSPAGLQGLPVGKLRCHVAISGAAGLSPTRRGKGQAAPTSRTQAFPRKGAPGRGPSCPLALCASGGPGPGEGVPCCSTFRSRCGPPAGQESGQAVHSGCWPRLPWPSGPISGALTQLGQGP